MPLQEELAAELCLLAPARLEHLIPPMPRMMHAVLHALHGTDQSVTVALKVRHGDMATPGDRSTDGMCPLYDVTTCANSSHAGVGWTPSILSSSSVAWLELYAI